MCRVVFTGDVDIIGMRQEIASAKKRVAESFVRGVEQRGQGERFGVASWGSGVFIGMVLGLELEKFPLQGRKRDGKRPRRRWSGGQSGWEECIEVADVWERTGWRLGSAAGR